MALLSDLASAPDVALRMGEVRVGGWEVRETSLDKLKKSPSLGPRDLKPNLRQKGVDIRIGLDIARLALNDTVRSLVVVTGDTDFVPAFKFARREGIRVYLDTLGRFVLPSLIEHSDLRLSEVPTPEEIKKARQQRQRQRQRDKRDAAAAEPQAPEPASAAKKPLKAAK